MFYLNQKLNLSASMIGGILGIIGFMSILGSLIAPYFIKRFHSGKIIAGATALGGILCFLLLATTNPILIAIIWGASMACSSVVIVTYFTMRQRAVSKDILGRAIATTPLLSFSSIPIAAVIGGVLVEEWLGMTMVILLCASIRLAVGVAAYFTPLVK